MIRKFHINLLLLITALALIGCRDMGLNGSELFEGVEGQAAETVINLGVPAFSAKVSRANQADEQKVNSLAVLVFDNTGQLTNCELIPSVDVSQPLKVRTTQGRGMRVVALANYTAVADLDNRLAQIKDYQSLVALAVTWNLTKGGDLLMVCNQQTGIVANTQLRMKLEYVLAKVTLNVSVSDRFPANESLEILNVELGSIPATAGLFFNSTVEQTFVDRQPMDMQGDAQQGLTATFYSLANVAGGRVEKASPVGGETEVANNAHMFKRHYAPQNASYAVIHAIHRTATVRRRVELYVYFGANNSNDYNLPASFWHTYTAVISGFDKMEVDTNVEYETMEFDLVQGNNTPMDAHADTRSMLLNATSGLMDVEVLSGSDWLSVSPLDLQQHQVRQPGQGKGEWQQDGGKGSFVRPKHKPAQGALAFSDATHALCRSITGIPMSGNQPLYFHATENTTSANRTAQIKLTLRKSDGQFQTEILTMNQRAAVGLGDGLLMEWSEEYASESYVNAPVQLKANQGMQWGYEQALLCNTFDRIFAGAFPTANAVYGRGEDSWIEKNQNFVQRNSTFRPTWSNTMAYRPKYASGVNGRMKVVEPYGGAKPSEPYYTPDYTLWDPHYSPVYGSSAARYCHEKNRDVNGDGVLSPEETEWYLPSVAELSHIWVVWNGLDESARPGAGTGWGENYWSASEQVASSAYTLAFASGEVGSREKNVPMRVRCVRRSNGVDTNPIRFENRSVVMDNSALPAGAVATSVKAMVPASVASNERVAKRLVVARKDASPKSGLKWHEAAGLPATYEYTSAGDRVATEETGCAAYAEKSDKSDKGTWRLPTARELVRLWSLTLEVHNLVATITSVNFLLMDGKRYWSASEENSYSAGCVSFEETPQNAFVNVERSQLHAVRCVREIP